MQDLAGTEQLLGDSVSWGTESRSQHTLLAPSCPEKLAPLHHRGRGRPARSTSEGGRGLRTSTRTPLPGAAVGAFRKRDSLFCSAPLRSATERALCPLVQSLAQPTGGGWGSVGDSLAPRQEVAPSPGPASVPPSLLHCYSLGPSGRRDPSEPPGPGRPEPAMWGKV